MHIDRNMTIRQELIHFLEQGPASIRDLSQLAGIMEKDVCHHLEFVSKSLKHQKKRLLKEPYSCVGCGFQFKDRKSFKKPGKCPECRGERIEPALFWIVAED